MTARFRGKERKLSSRNMGAYAHRIWLQEFRVGELRQVLGLRNVS